LNYDPEFDYDSDGVISTADATEFNKRCAEAE